MSYLKKLTNDFGKGFDRTNFVDSVSRQSILSWFNKATPINH